MTILAHAQIAFDAARVAVLSARSAVVPRHVAGPHHYRLNDSGRSLTAAQAAADLASMTKPVRLHAHTAHGEVIVAAVPGQLNPHKPTAGGRTPFDRSILAFLYEKFRTAAIAGLDVVCVGAGDVVRVGALAVVEWERDYWYDGFFGHAADFIDAGTAEAEGVAARFLSGAAALISFGGQDAETFLDSPPRGRTLH